MTKNRESKSRYIDLLIESKLISSNDKLIVAVSGGMDSMFLLNILIELQKKLKVELVIGHVNHKIRPSSKNDEYFVIEQGKLFGVPVIVKQLNYSEKKSGESTEAWARDSRYSQLEIIRKNLDFDKIVTGHHANDQIETILQRISEKAGIGGFRGIHSRYGRVIRPMLKVSKTEIVNFVKESNIKYIDDETNRDLGITRNYFRHKIIPRWESRYPDLGESIQAICDNATTNKAVINYFLEQLTIEIITEGIDDKKNQVYNIKCSELDKLPKAIKILLFRHILGRSPWRKYKWNDIENIIESAKPGKIYSFDKYEILKDRQDWIIRNKLNVAFDPIIIDFNKTVLVDNYLMQVRRVNNFSFEDNSNTEFIAEDVIANKKLILRLWQDGDTFLPLGMQGRKSISNFLIDEKVNQFDKDNQLVLTADDEIIWICGRRISDLVKITKDTKQYLELSIRTNVG